MIQFNKNAVTYVSFLWIVFFTATSYATDENVGEIFYKDLMNTTNNGIASKTHFRDLFKEMYLPVLLKKNPNIKQDVAYHQNEFYQKLKDNYQRKILATRNDLSSKGFDLTKIQYVGAIEVERTVWKSSRSKDAKVKLPETDKYHMESINYLVTLKQGDHFVFLEVYGMLYNEDFSVLEVKGIAKDIQKSSTRYRVMHENLQKLMVTCIDDSQLQGLLVGGRVLKSDDKMTYTTYKTDLQFYRPLKAYITNIEEKVSYNSQGKKGSLKVREFHTLKADLGSYGSMNDAMQDLIVILGFLSEPVKTGLQRYSLTTKKKQEVIFTPTATSLIKDPENNKFEKVIFFRPSAGAYTYVINLEMQKRASSIYKSGHAIDTKMNITKILGN